MKTLVCGLSFSHSFEVTDWNRVIMCQVGTGHFVPRSFLTQVISYHFGKYVPTFIFSFVISYPVWSSDLKFGSFYLFVYKETTLHCTNVCHHITQACQRSNDSLPGTIRYWVACCKYNACWRRAIFSHLLSTKLLHVRFHGFKKSKPQYPGGDSEASLSPSPILYDI